MRISLDVARGIDYLYEECEVQIIDSNINPRNILLEESSTAKISSFGLAKINKLALLLGSEVEEVIWS